MTLFNLDPLAWNLCKLTWFALYAGMAVGAGLGWLYGRLFGRW